MVEQVRELNEGKLVGKRFRHFKRGSVYTLTGFSIFKSSGGHYASPMDEHMMVHYKDEKGNPHTRFYSDFFSYESEESSFRFIEL